MNGITEDIFELRYPRRIVFGVGAAGRLADYLDGYRRPLVLLGRHLQDSGFARGLRGTLDSRECLFIDGVTPEPPLAEVDDLIAAGRGFRADAVVAVGGGSVIDAAKAAAALIPAEGSVAEYFHNRRSIDGKGLFFLAAPTTAGSGAEITPNAVLTDIDSKIKRSIRHPSMTADVALVDPELTLSCPRGLSAASGLDALTQALESFTTRKANAATRALAREAVALIVGNLPAVDAAPDNLAARTDVARGSLLSAMAFSQSGLGAAHGLSHPIGSLLGVPHGVACAILLPHVLRWNLDVAAADFAELATACGLGRNAGDFIGAVELLIEKLGVPADFAAYGLQNSHLPFILEHCRGNSMSGNPREISDEEIIRLLGT